MTNRIINYQNKVSLGDMLSGSLVKFMFIFRTKLFWQDNITLSTYSHFMMNLRMIITTLSEKIIFFSETLVCPLFADIYYILGILNFIAEIRGKKDFKMHNFDLKIISLSSVGWKMCLKFLI